VAVKELSTMTDEAIAVVDEALDKRLKKVKNKEVKSCVLQSCVLQEKYQALVEEWAVQHLQNMAPDVMSMIHQRRQTYAELANLLTKVKVGDWLEVEADYSKRVCSNGVLVASPM
jgi:hypothetical protein